VDVVRFMQRTLCAVQRRSLNVDISDVTQSLLQQLIDDGLVTRRQQTDTVTTLDVTRLGKAVYKGKCHKIPLHLYFTTSCCVLLCFFYLFICSAAIRGVIKNDFWSRSMCC